MNKNNFSLAGNTAPATGYNKGIGRVIDGGGRRDQGACKPHPDR